MMSLPKRNSGSAVHLCAMMFLQFFVLGCTMPIVTLYFKEELGFSGSRIGVIMAVTSLSSLLSPLVGACVADRLISAERLLSLSHFLGAISLYSLSLQTDYIAVLLLNLTYWLIIGPSTALTTAITFHHSPQAIKTFGGIRLWGTLGWIAAAWIFRLFFVGKTASADSQDLRAALQLSVWASLILALFSLTIPPAAGKKTAPVVLFPRDSLRIILKKPILTFSISAILIAIADRIYMFGAGPYLKSIGFNDRNILPVLSIGQIPEIFGLMLLGALIIRLGMKKVFLLGATLEIIRFSIFASLAKGFPLYAGISLHGLTYGFFFATASIFIDINCSHTTRSGAHQYFTLIVSGFSTLAGNAIAGLAADLARNRLTGSINFPFFWIIPLLFSLSGFFGILFFFREKADKVKSATVGTLNN